MWHEDIFSQRNKTKKEQERVGRGWTKFEKVWRGGGGKEYSEIFIK